MKFGQGFRLLAVLKRRAKGRAVKLFYYQNVYHDPIKRRGSSQCAGRPRNSRFELEIDRLHALRHGMHVVFRVRVIPKPKMLAALGINPENHQ